MGRGSRAVGGCSARAVRVSLTSLNWVWPRSCLYERVRLISPNNVSILYLFRIPSYLRPVKNR